MVKKAMRRSNDDRSGLRVAVNLHLPGYRANRERSKVVGIADPTPARLEAARAAVRSAAVPVYADPYESWACASWSPGRHRPRATG